MLKEKLVRMKAFDDGFRQAAADGSRPSDFEPGGSAGGTGIFLAGTDEAGRGPLAGPVVAACAVLPEDFDVLGVDDSKKLSEKRREELFALITEKALAYGVGTADNLLIDEINILEATKRAMAEAIEKASEMLTERTGKGPDYLITDAVTLKAVDLPQTAVIKGDAESLTIAAASIIAKVTRDRIMLEYDGLYPGYGFASNKGYGTKAHYDGISKLGITPIHRKTFLKNIV